MILASEPTDLPLVLGCWGIGGAFRTPWGPTSYGSVSEEIFQDVCDIAFAEGIRWVDVAPGYGNFEALSRLHRWLSSRGRSFQIALKLGRSYRAGRAECRLDRESLTAEFKEGVARLGRLPSAIMLKDPPPDFLRAEGLCVRLEAVSRWLAIDAIGIATHDLELADIVAQGHGRVLQIEYNGVTWRRAHRLAHTARKRGWTVWGMQPLAYGFLAERNSLSIFCDDDFRAHLPDSVKLGLSALAREFHRKLDDFRGYSLAERALAFCFCSPVLDKVVIGPKSRMQLESAFRALELAGSSEFKLRVDSSFREAAFGPF